MAGFRYWQGDALTLRALKPSDAQWFLACDDDIARNVDAILWPTTEAKMLSWFEQQQKARFDDSFRFMADNAQGATVGTIDTFQCHRRHGTFKYGVAVAAEHRGQGYAGEMIAMVLRYYFHELGYQKATPHVYAFNDASVRLHEKLGFTLEGRLRRMVYADGRFHDELHFGMTREEFDVLHGHRFVR